MITNGILIVVLTIYAEARGEPLAGKVAVARVIANRAQLRGTTMADECLRPRQFSCWNGGLRSPAMRLLKTKASQWAWQDCVEAMRIIEKEVEADRSTFTHYYNPAIATPGWALGVKQTKIGNHVFLTLPYGRKRK